MSPTRRKTVVALKYDGAEKPAPYVVAKGKGMRAEKILDLAADAGVPIYEDRLLVDILFTLECDTEIPVELYQAVAQVLVFVYQIKERRL